MVQAYHAAERSSALAKLMRFAARSKFEEMHRAALDLFWGEWLSREPDPELENVMTSEPVEIAYNSWFVFDFDYDGGRRMVEIFIDSEARQLSSGELNYLRGMRGSHLRLYEILDVKSDQGFEVRDLWDERRFYVRERAGTRQIVAWDLVVARIGLGETGEKVFETLPYVFSAAQKEDLLRRLRKAHRIFTREYRGKNLAEFFKTMAPVFHKLWLEHVALPPRPKIVTGDGEPFVFARVIFDLLDREAAIRFLADRDDIVDHGDGSYAWLEPAGAFQRSAGTMALEEKRVVFETTSQKRAEKARDELPALLGSTLRFRAISYGDVEQAIKRAPRTAKPKEPDISVEAQHKILGEYYENHYRKWLDEPVPALGNRTPRHAAKLKTVRPKLIALLKDFESHSERQRRSGQITYDFRWMWEELGLPRE
jgi:hypothetical protein